MQLRARDTKLTQVSGKPAARLKQDKHKSVPLLQAEAARQLPALVAEALAGQHGLPPAAELRCPGSASAQPSSFIPYHKRYGSTSWYAGHQSWQGEVRLHCCATHRTICLVFTRCGTDELSSTVLWLNLSIITFYGAGKQPAR